MGGEGTTGIPSYLGLLATVAPVFLVMLLGFGMRGLRVLTAEADRSLLQLTVNALYPCLVADFILGNAALANPVNFLLPPVLGFATVGLGYGLCLVCAPLFGLRTAAERGTFAFVTGTYNYGYLPLPLILKIYGSETAGVLCVFNLGVEIGMWTMGIATLTGATPRESLRKIVNVPSMAILAGLLLNLAGGRTWLPGFVLAGVHLVGQSAIPMGLVLIGATMFDLCRQLDLHAGWRALAGAVLLRLVVTPPLFIWLAWSLPASALELRHVLIVQAGMPAAILPIVLARHYDGDARLAVRIVLVTTAVGLLLVPFWLRWGGG